VTREGLQIPLLVRLLLANALVVAVGAVAGTLTTRALADRSSLGLIAAFVLAGMALSLLINYVVLRITLRPLTDLSTAVDSVRDGQTSLRASGAASQDPDIARLVQSLNTMLDRLASHTTTIEANREQLRALSAKVITAQEEERKRIARELHDDTSQSLATLLIALERMDSAIPPGLVDLKERLASARALTAETIDGLRALVVYLRPLLLDDLGLVPAIRWYAGNRLGPEGIDLEFEAPADPPRMSPEAETALFRIAQEAINNIVKHADASTVRISLLADGGATLLVEDDGLGFEDASVFDEDGSAHLGLFGIRERAAAIGGVVTVESSPGVGTTVRVRVPLEVG
jgi:two-component system sensor histidine kinase UhpB